MKYWHFVKLYPSCNISQLFHNLLTQGHYLQVLRVVFSRRCNLSVIDNVIQRGSTPLGIIIIIIINLSSEFQGMPIDQLFCSPTGQGQPNFGKKINALVSIVFTIKISVLKTTTTASINNHLPPLPFSLLLPFLTSPSQLLLAWHSFFPWLLLLVAMVY